MVGATNADKSGTPDTAEFFNVSKNDMIVDDSKMSRSWPQVTLDHKPLFAKYCRASHSTGLMIMDILADKLGVDKEEIRKRHVLEDLAGDHIRMTRGPPRKTAEMPEIQTPSHTDFGTWVLSYCVQAILVVLTSSQHYHPDELARWSPSLVRVFTQSRSPRARRARRMAVGEAEARLRDRQSRRRSSQVYEWRALLWATQGHPVTGRAGKVASLQYRLLRQTHRPQQAEDPQGPWYPASRRSERGRGRGEAVDLPTSHGFGIEASWQLTLFIRDAFQLQRASISCTSLTAVPVSTSTFSLPILTESSILMPKPRKCCGQRS